ILKDIREKRGAIARSPGKYCSLFIEVHSASPDILWIHSSLWWDGIHITASRSVRVTFERERGPQFVKEDICRTDEGNYPMSPYPQDGNVQVFLVAASIWDNVNSNL